MASFKSNAIADIVLKVDQQIDKSKRVVFLSGNFNVLHPGHMRLLNFASECGDFLVVGVAKDDVQGTLIHENLRLEGVQAISAVNLAFLLPCPPDEFIAALKPSIVVKGKEHEDHFNPEQAVVDSYGGKLLFSSGEARFSSMALLQMEMQMQPSMLSALNMPIPYLERHHVDIKRLVTVIEKFKKLRVVVIGDLIVDEYITCDALGMSQEDPTVVVTPIKHDRFIGGAGIVAAHAASLGAKVSYFGVSGKDEISEFASQKLVDTGVSVNLIADPSRPTTLKQRFRASGKTLLRVSHLKQHDISHDCEADLMDRLIPSLYKADLVIFSDFNYGCLPQTLVDKVSAYCSKIEVPMVADSQSSSQVGDISRFKGMMLITPTEHEARLALRDSTSGLVVLTETLRHKASADHVFITLGSEGVLVHSPMTESNGILTDQLPALNISPKDVSGAGDSMLTSTAMALVSGANIWESAFIGSVAAACQVSRVGNLPLKAKELKEVLTR